MKSNQRYILLSFLAAATAVGFAVRGVAGPVMAALEVADPRYGPVQVSSLLGLVTGIVVFVVLLRSIAAVLFTDEVIAELRKVTWPSKEETFRSTAVVVGTSLFIALTLAGFDLLWARVTGAFLFTEG